MDIWIPYRIADQLVFSTDVSYMLSTIVEQLIHYGSEETQVSQSKYRKKERHVRVDSRNIYSGNFTSHKRSEGQSNYFPHLLWIPVKYWLSIGCIIRDQCYIQQIMAEEKMVIGTAQCVAILTGLQNTGIIKKILFVSEFSSLSTSSALSDVTQFTSQEYRKSM